MVTKDVFQNYYYKPCNVCDTAMNELFGNFHNIVTSQIFHGLACRVGQNVNDDALMQTCGLHNSKTCQYLSNLLYIELYSCTEAVKTLQIDGACSFLT